MNKIFILIFSISIILFSQIIKLSANDDTYINSSNITYNEKENIIELSENSKINYKNTAGHQGDFGVSQGAFDRDRIIKL